MLYIFHGADSFSRREALAELKAALDEDGSLAANTTLFSGRQAAPDEVIAACSALPFLGGRRLVVVEGLLAAVPGGRRKGKPDGSGGDNPLGAWGQLAEFAPQMPDSNVLVLSDGEVERDNPLLAALRPHGKELSFPPKNPRELPGWVQKRAQKIGLRIEPRAAELLAKTAGDQERGRGDDYNDLWALANELDKLLAYAGGALVREEDVRALTPVLREQKSYLLCDAIAEGRAAAAAKLLHEILSQDEHPAVVLSTIAGRYRLLAIARELLDAGEGTAAVGRAVNRQGYGLERLMEQASRISLDGIRECYRRIVQADIEPKRGIGEEATALELLVQQLAAGAAAGRAPAA
jgi:DNA polymerase-3 subunit delta